MDLNERRFMADMPAGNVRVRDEQRLRVKTCTHPLLSTENGKSRARGGGWRHSTSKSRRRRKRSPWRAWNEVGRFGCTENRSGACREREWRIENSVHCRYCEWSKFKEGRRDQRVRHLREMRDVWMALTMSRNKRIWRRISMGRSFRFHWLGFWRRLVVSSVLSLLGTWTRLALLIARLHVSCGSYLQRGRDDKTLTLANLISHLPMGYHLAVA